MSFAPYTPLSNVRAYDPQLQGNSPQTAPKFTLHRSGRTAIDSAASAVRSHGMNMSGFEEAIIRVVPTTSTGDPAPNVEAMFWSEEAGKFVSEATALAATAPAAKTPYDFRVRCQGRIMWVKLTGTIVVGDGDSVDVLVAGVELDHNR